jgi:hypothetical protein
LAQWWLEDFKEQGEKEGKFPNLLESHQFLPKFYKFCDKAGKEQGNGRFSG